MPRGIPSLVAFAVAGLLAASAQAATTYDANLVNPGWYNGSGNPNGGFTVETAGNLEIGLRAKLRQNPAVIHSLNNVYNVPIGAQTNTTSGGNGAHAGRAAWNWEWSINTQAGGGSADLADIAARITVSDADGHSASINPFTQWADNSYYGSSGEYTASLGDLPNNPAANPALLANYFGAQQSNNPTFGDFPLAAFYNLNAHQTYTITLDVFGGNSFTAPLLASNTIIVNVGDGRIPAVPVPAAAFAAAPLLGALGLYRLRRTRKTAQ